MRKFERSLPMALLKARESVMKKFIPYLREEGVTPQQWRVLRALYDSKGIEMSALCKVCYLLMPSLSRIIQHLESQQLIRRTTSAQDMRCSIINLTELGAAMVDKISPQSEARYQHITDAFGYGKLELLYELLDELVEKLESYDDFSKTAKEQ